MAALSAQELLRQHGIAFVESRAGKYTTNCPHCSEGYLNVKIERDGVAWFCHSCQLGGGGKFDQQRESSGSNGLGPIKACYDYTDENGARLFQALRFEPINGPKQFRQRTGPDQDKWSVKGVRMVPFRLPELLDDLAQGHVVFVVEGEKDVITLREQGVPATCNPMGAGKWWPEFNEILAGADVVICGDNDPPGRAHVQLVAKNLLGIAARLRVLDLAKVWTEIKPSDDITNWFEHSGTAGALWDVIERLPDYYGETNGPDQHSGNGQTAWPTATSYVFPDPAAIPPRQWLYAGHYVRRAATATVAPGGFGKTTLTLFELISMALEGKCVWYISGEDPKDEIDRRIAAHCQHHGSNVTRIAGRLFVDDKQSFPLTIGSSPRTAVVRFDETWLARFEQEIRSNGIDVVALDPFISFHSVPESDNGAIDQIVKRLALIAQNTSCCIELSHHVRKSVQGGLQGELTVDDTRGGSSIVNAVRSCRVINRMNSNEAALARISADDRPSYIRLDRGKRNMAPSEKAFWMHIVSVHLPNGDNVQAIERYQFKDAFEGMTTAAIDWVQQFLRAGGPRRASSQSEDWLGHYLGRYCGRDDTHEKAGAIWANKVIGTWLRNKVIKRVPMRDPDTRKPNVPFYAANEFQEGDGNVILFPRSDDDEH